MSHEPNPPRPAPPKRKRPRDPFVCLPRALATHPPIRHRGDSADAGLTPFEFVIAATVADLARAQLNAARHAAAFKSGARALERQRSHPSKDLAFRVGRTTYQFYMAGQGGYQSGWHAYDARGQRFLMETSARALLSAAGIARGSRSRAALPVALRRLTKPVADLPPLLNLWSKTKNGRLRLDVNARWLPTKKYVRVPWPPPTVGSTVLALYLFLTAVDLRGETTSIRSEMLLRRLGIPRAHAARSLDRALDRVNVHLAALNEAGALDRAELPSAFDIVPMRNGRRIRFVVRDDRAEREEERAAAEKQVRIEAMYHRHEAKRAEAEREKAERREWAQMWKEKLKATP